MNRYVFDDLNQQRVEQHLVDFYTRAIENDSHIHLIYDKTSIYSILLTQYFHSEALIKFPKARTSFIDVFNFKGKFDQQNPNDLFIDLTMLYGFSTFIEKRMFTFNFEKHKFYNLYLKLNEIFRFIDDTESSLINFDVRRQIEFIISILNKNVPYINYRLKRLMFGIRLDLVNNITRKSTVFNTIYNELDRLSMLKEYNHFETLVPEYNQIRDEIKFNLILGECTLFHNKNKMEWSADTIERIGSEKTIAVQYSSENIGDIIVVDYHYAHHNDIIFKHQMISECIKATIPDIGKMTLVVRYKAFIEPNNTDNHIYKFDGNLLFEDRPLFKNSNDTLKTLLGNNE